MSFWTAASICCGWKGLRTQALAPAACPSAFLESWPSVVSMMMGTNLRAGSFLASLTKVIPSIRGMFTSEMIRWTLAEASLSRASWPSEASMTS
ncbi:hypothetical protein D3C72_2149750 [compost metagenome]